ncbi:MAG: hypothetical protein KME06_16960 [Kastovskya adunca ATA6-11-RM4]|nr:hypothetical protein [Kastovskya adunca ATA6-11-RM4]
MRFVAIQSQLEAQEELTAEAEKLKILEDLARQSFALFLKMSRDRYSTRNYYCRGKYFYLALGI